MIEMLRHALRMLLNLSLLLLATLTLLFFLVRLAGDPALILSGESSDPAVLEEIRRSLGLDQPLYRQYLIFLWQAVQLDLGTSWVSGQDALALALERLGPTLALALAAIVLHLSLSIPLGAFLGATRSSIGVIGKVSRSLDGLVLLAQGIPGYVVALMLIQWFAVKWQIFPSTGSDGVASLVLPALTITAFLAPKLIRVLAVNVGDALQDDYAVMARAQGASEPTVVLRHALPNALLGATALIGTQIANLVNGIIITETIFGWPGMGRLLLDSVLLLDFPVVQSVVLVTTTLVFAANQLADYAIRRIDPRIRYS
ncbi:MAG: ABC transporter permease [Steroidobacteraceae bacterium]